MQKAVEQLLRNSAIRRAGQAALAPPSSLRTGFQELDEVLPGGGWPTGCLTEILIEHEGIGELSLLMPALATLSQERRWLAWISPPHIPYGPALVNHGVELSRVLLVHARPGKDTFWAVEQGLTSGTCSTVLTWPGEELDDRILRRLQLAAEGGHSTGFLFRPARAAATASPAALRVSLESAPEGLLVRVLKCRGRAGAAVLVPCLTNAFTPVLERVAAYHHGMGDARSTHLARNSKALPEASNRWQENRLMEVEDALVEPVFPRLSSEHHRARRSSH